MTKIVAQKRVNDNLLEIGNLLQSLEAEHNFPTKNDFKIRMARIYMYETIKLLDENKDVFADKKLEQVIQKINEYEQALNYFHTLRYKREFSLRRY